MYRSPLLGLGLALAILSGCATGPGTPPKPVAGNQFDGVYAGNNVSTRGGGQACGPPAYQQTVVVQAGRFIYPFAPNPPVTSPIPVQVFADGSFSEKTQYGINDPTPVGQYRTYWLSIIGGISNGTLDGVIDDQWCVRHMTLQRR